MRCPATAAHAAAAAAWAPPPLVRRGAASRQPAVLCRARKQQPEIEPDAAGSGLQTDWPATGGSAESSQAQPPQTKDFWQSLDSSLAAARKEFLQNLLELPQTARGAIELLPQMHYPTPRFIARYTTQILLVVAAFLVYVVLVDRINSAVPRFILWTREHPGWPQRAAAAAGPAAAEQLAALQLGAAQLAGQLAAAATAAPGLLQAAAASAWALASSPEALRQAVAGWLAALGQTLVNAALFSQSLVAGLLVMAKRRLVGA